MVNGPKLEMLAAGEGEGALRLGRGVCEKNLSTGCRKWAYKVMRPYGWLAISTIFFFQKSETKMEKLRFNR